MAKLTDDEIENRINYHPPTETKKILHSIVRAVIRDSMNTLNDSLPEGREKATAFTKLEEVMFWSNAAIARSREQAQ